MRLIEFSLPKSYLTLKFNVLPTQDKKYRLHSHPVPYGTGSGQNSVTLMKDVRSTAQITSLSSWFIIPPQADDMNSYWAVALFDEQSDHGFTKIFKQINQLCLTLNARVKIKCGSSIRLKHIGTKGFLRRSVQVMSCNRKSRFALK